MFDFLQLLITNFFVKPEGSISFIFEEVAAMIVRAVTWKYSKAFRFVNSN